MAVESVPLAAMACRDYLASADDLVWIGSGGMLLRQDCQPRFELRHMNAEDLDLSLHLGAERGICCNQAAVHVRLSAPRL
jgi:hypothetical protein